MTRSKADAAIIERAKAALDLMQQHGVPPTPDNYAVWFSYVGKTVPALTAAIDSVLAKGGAFTPTMNEDFRKAATEASSEDAALGDIAKRVENAVGRIIGYVDTASKGVVQYEDSLASFSGRIAEDLNPEALTAVVGEIVAATRSVLEANEQLASKLYVSSNEVSRLRDDVLQLRREASVDHLTKLFNRKMFDASLREAADLSDQKGNPVSLLMVDIDYFKKFNDTHGHQLGDQVLKLVARTLSDNVRDSDTAARYGGEEFSVVLPMTALKDALGRAEVIRNMVASRNITNRVTGENLGQVTMSVGVAQYRKGEDLHELIQRADEALYHAKRTGRNRVCSEADLESQSVAV